MISLTFSTVFVYCLAYAFGQTQERAQSEVSTEKPLTANRPLTDVGYLRYGDPFYIYPSPEERRILSALSKNPTDTNEIESSDPERRPLFIFTTAPLTSSQKQTLSQSGPFIEIRKKRDVSADAAVPESSLPGKLRKKRSYCKKCGGGGYGGYGGYGGGYVPVSYAVYPVYTSYQPTYVPSYGGGCNTCGGGGGHGGGGGSYSYSSSSSKSSSGSWGYGK